MSEKPQEWRKLAELELWGDYGEVDVKKCDLVQDALKDAADLVDALEKERDARLAEITAVRKCWDDAAKERDRYREVLEFYASASYLNTLGGEGHIALDRGRLARAALEKP